MRRFFLASLLALTCLRLSAQNNTAPALHDNVIQTYGGNTGMTTAPFKVNDSWEIRWTAPVMHSLKLTVFGSDGGVVAGSSSHGRGVIYLAKGGSYYVQIEVEALASPGGASQPPSSLTTPGGGFSGNLPGTGNGGGDQAPPNSNPYTAPGTTPGYMPPSAPQLPWAVQVVELKSGNTALPSLAPNGVNGGSNQPVGLVYLPPTGETGGASPPTPSAPPAPTGGNGAPVTLTDAQTRAVVLIKGDNWEGTGFLVKLGGVPAVITNLHVLSNNPNVQITTSSGAAIKILGLKGAQDRDLAVISIADGNYSYLDLAADVGATVQNGDQVITPGNSEGGEVMLNTAGLVLGIGPQRVEINNPIYHGNSGGPIFHVKSGKVVGVVTEGMKVDTSDALDKASSESGNSAISGTMRYFGLRLDNVPVWETYDWRRFQTETIFLAQFHHQSRCLDSYLNGETSNAPSENDGDFKTLYLTDEAIKRANASYDDSSAGADGAQKMDALRGLLDELRNIGDSNMDDIQNPNNFYSFDRLQAKDELAYRKQLLDELVSIGNDVSRLGNLARSNN